MGSLTDSASETLPKVHDWMLRFLEHRIGDQRILRLVQKWLKAGVLEDGKRHRTESGTPQGGSVSPFLANVYLHYVFASLWRYEVLCIQSWRRRRRRRRNGFALEAKGDVVVVRWADDFIVGFQHECWAHRLVDKSLSSNYDLCMNVKLTPELERIIQEKVNSGLYSDQSEVVREGLRLLLERDREHADSREAWKRSLAIGLQEANSVQLLPGDEVLAHFRADLESRL